MAVPKVNLRQVKRKSGTFYMIDYAINGRRIREIVGKNKREAEVIRSTKERDLAFGVHNIKSEEIISIGLNSVINEYLNSKNNAIRGSSLRRYQNYYIRLSDFFKTNFPKAFEDIRNIKPNYINECFDHLLGKKVGWSRNTLKSFKEKISSLFIYAIKNGYIDVNPVSDTKDIRVKQTRKVDFYTDEELKQIYETIDPFWLDHIKFMYHTGIRKGEIISLRWENVNLGKIKFITIISSEDWETKTGRSRQIPLNETASKIIERWKDKHPELVFTDKKGRKIHPNYPYNALKKALKKNGIKGDLHKLRHSFASKLVMSDVDLYTVKELLGHSELAMTQIYAHLSKGHLKRAVDKLV